MNGLESGAPREAPPPVPSAPQPMAIVYRDNVPEFARLIRRFPWLTWTLIALNVSIFCAIIFATGAHRRGLGQAFLSWFEISDLIRYGAMYPPFVREGEYWRLISCSFLHAGVLHILLNMYVLAAAGRLVENIYGRRAFLAIYVAGAVGGAAAGCFGRSDPVPSIGASTAIMGLIGALVGCGILYHRRLPDAYLRRFVPRLIFWTAFILGAGFLINQFAERLGIMLGNLEHLGGFLGGVAAGALPPARLVSGRFPKWIRNAAAAGAVVALVMTLAGYLNPLRYSLQASQHSPQKLQPFVPFESADYGFHLDVPKNLVMRNPEPGLFVFQRSYGGFVFAVFAAERPEMADAFAMVRHEREKLQEEGRSELVTRLDSGVMLGNAEAARLTARFVLDDGGEVEEVIYAVVGKRHAYYIQFQYRPHSAMDQELAETVAEGFFIDG